MTVMDGDLHVIWSEPVPLFPLPNCVLLPGAILPLHIFEPRYRRMMRDVLDLPPERQAVAIALLREGYEPLYLTNHAPIHAVVGVGTVVEHRELPDGRYDLILQGQARASIKVDDGSGPYRRAVLAPHKTVPLPEGADDAACDDLRTLLDEASAMQLWPAEATERIFNAGLPLEPLLDLVAWHFAVRNAVPMRQRVLEERRVRDRLRILQASIEQTIATTRYAAACRPRPGTWPPALSQN